MCLKSEVHSVVQNYATALKPVLKVAQNPVLSRLTNLESKLTEFFVFVN